MLQKYLGIKRINKSDKHKNSKNQISKLTLLNFIIVEIVQGPSNTIRECLHLLASVLEKSDSGRFYCHPEVVIYGRTINVLLD